VDLALVVKGTMAETVLAPERKAVVAAVALTPQALTQFREPLALAVPVYPLP
jgi:hypothetical protein